MAHVVKNLSAMREDPDSISEERNGNPFQSVLLPGEVHGQRSLVGYSPWGSTKLVFSVLQ